MRSRGYEREGLGELTRKLRRQPTLAEDRLWQALRRKALGTKFRRQVPYGCYILDFVSLECALVIEVDGGQHQDNPTDRARDAWLRERGLTVLRYWNNQVMMDLPTVLADIDLARRAAKKPPAP